MATGDVKNFRAATNTEARHGGEQSLAGSVVSPEIMATLHAELVLAHLPFPASEKQRAAGNDGGAFGAASANDSSDASRATLASAVLAPSLRDEAAQRAAYAPPFVGKADMLTCIYYVVAFLTLARPVTINHLTFDYVTFPDMKKAENFQLFHKSDVWAPCLLCVVDERLSASAGLSSLSSLPTITCYYPHSFRVLLGMPFSFPYSAPPPTLPSHLSPGTSAIAS